MNYEEYRNAYLVAPAPEPRYRFGGSFGTTLYFEDFDEAVEFYRQVLGPPAYAEGAGTRGWPIGSGWLTLLRGRSGNPQNVEVVFQLETPAEAERLQRAFIEAGGEGPAPTDQLMYERVRFCPVRDPFGTELLIISRSTGGAD
jgi:catechol 2,3-dioxygenase-like lactoylglutathione lyase family enzyme